MVQGRKKEKEVVRVEVLSPNQGPQTCNNPPPGREKGQKRRKESKKKGRRRSTGCDANLRGPGRGAGKRRECAGRGSQREGVGWW